MKKCPNLDVRCEWDDILENNIFHIQQNLTTAHSFFLFFFSSETYNLCRNSIKYDSISYTRISEK